MRTTFGLLLGALCLLSGLVWYFQPPPGKAGKITLVRQSDNNNLRVAQDDLFVKLHPEFDLQLDPNGNGVENTIVQAMAGVGPDLFDCFDPSQLSAYVRAGIAWDITDELAKRGIDIRRDCFHGILKTAIYDGRVYGVPTNIAADGLWFHRDILRRYGIPVHRGPWKWSEFIPIAEKLTERDAEGRPIRYGFYFDWWSYGDFFKGFGARLFNEDGTQCTVDSPQAIAAVQLMHDLVYKYKVSSSPVEEASMATAGGFGSGNISVFGSKHSAMALGGRYWLAQLRQYKGLELGVMESPYQTERRFHAYGRATLINKASAHREEALKFLLYMAGPQYNRLVNDQADSVCAFKKYAQGQEFLLNPAYPNETDNAVWRTVTELADPDETSPYVNGQIVSRVMNDQLDLVKSNQKSPADAMRDAATQINDSMQKGLTNDPALAERYRKAIAKEGR